MTSQRSAIFAAPVRTAIGTFGVHRQRSSLMSCKRGASLQSLFQAGQRSLKRESASPILWLYEVSGMVVPADLYFGRERGANGMVEDGVASLEF